MKEANEHRVRKATTAFAIITALLSLGHIATLILSVMFVRDRDDLDPIFGEKKLNYWVNLPFTVVLCIFTFLQFFSAINVLCFNLRTNKTKTIYYSALIGMLSIFGLGIYLVLEGIEYNFATRLFPKDAEVYPQLMPLYWTIQVTSTASFLFMFPMMAFVFYHKLQRYLALQRSEQSQSPPKSSETAQSWCLSLFLIHSLAQIVLIVNFYQLTAVQNTKTYSADNAADLYTFFIGSALIIEFVSIILQFKNLIKPFLSKTQAICLAVTNGLFMMATLVLQVLLTAKIFIELSVGGDLICLYKDCDSLNEFKWQIMGYTILNLLSMIIWVPYLKQVSIRPEKEQQRDTLLTTEEAVQQ